MATRAATPARKRAGSNEGGDVDPALPQKKRARHRLIGAIVLCLVAGVVVPMLLDPEPTRPGSDVAIVIPSKDTPLPPRAAQADPKGAESAAVEGRGGASDTKAEIARPADPKAEVGTKPVDARPVDSKTGESKASDAKAAEAKAIDPKAADPKATDPKVAKTEPARKDGRDEIQQLLDATQARSPAKTDGRFVLQVGAYSGESGANAAVQRVQGLGLRAYTEPVKTDKGDRLRVRVGPYASREAAEQALAKLKAAGVQAALIAQ